MRAESAQRLRVYIYIAVVQLRAHIANPSIANTQRVGSDVATQIRDLEARSPDGEELGGEPSRADSDDRHTAADGAPSPLAYTATLAATKPEASTRQIAN